MANSFPKMNDIKPIYGLDLLQSNSLFASWKAQNANINNVVSICDIKTIIDLSDFKQHDVQ